MTDKRSFWTSVPATLTGTAALVTAIVGLLNRTDRIESKAATPTVDPAPVHVVEYRTEPPPSVDPKPEPHGNAPIKAKGAEKRRQEKLADPQRERTPLPDISGMWRDTEGTSYVISQSGVQFTVQEITQYVGVTAQGEGVLGDPITFSALTSEGVTVVGELQLSANGSQLSGQYTDVTTGDSLPLVLRR